MEDLLGVFAVFVLVGLNGFFVAAEFSLVGARRTRITQLADEGSGGAKAALRAIEHLDNYIAATQLGITLASLALGWIGEPAIAHLIEPVLHGVLSEAAASTVTHTISVAIAFSLVTILHIVIGELVPKSIALQRPEGTVVVVSRPITWFARMFRPVIWLMNGIGNTVVRMIGFQPSSEHASVHSAEEIEMLVHSSRVAGLIEENEATLLRRVFDFGDTRAEEIMRPRVEVDSISIDSTLPEILEIVAANHHSRYPVYMGTIDTIVGIMLTKDLLDALIAQPELLAKPDASFDINSILRTPLFVPRQLKLDELLTMMRETNTHLAIVIDEYGGTAGVATMEDILEELVGEVRDEFDIEETDPISLTGNRFNVDGLVSLHEAIERFGDPGGEPQSTTIGGYVAETLNRIPAVGDQVTFGKYELKVAEMDGMRVARVQFVKRPEVQPDDAAIRTGDESEGAG